MKELRGYHPQTFITHSYHIHFGISDFTGSYILSGGEEAVLVLWQYKTHYKQFLPRLGAPIKHISSSPDDTLISVSHIDNGKVVQ